jgi:hypothetical protein
MGPDVLRRVRWGNVALACAVLAALAGVVVWPLFSAAAPRLPPDAPRPLVAVEPAPRTERGPETGGRSAERRRRNGAKRARRPRGRAGATAVDRERRAARRGRARGRDRSGGPRGARRRTRDESRRPGRERERRERAGEGGDDSRRSSGTGDERRRPEDQAGRGASGRAAQPAAPPRAGPPRGAPPRAARRTGTTRDEFGFEG